ncbi:hypothetical protein AMECASPLE_006742 [Ameca splendens]|uniref:Ig-like domain-containing protein n=1 Tax=Ameca splendens TaxID=208324 RepID=A0ABV0XCI6_9TELE
MGVFMFFVFCSLMGSVATAEIKLDPDRPFLRVPFSGTADLKCCYKDGPQNFTWIKSNSSKVSKKNQMHTVIMSEDVIQSTTESEGKLCGILTLRNVKLSDTGLYQCSLNKEVQTHGTYLQVFSEYVGVRVHSPGQANQQCVCVYVCGVKLALGTAYTS